MVDKKLHTYAGVFLVTRSGKLIGQRRDNKPTIDNPNKIGSFGGTVEPGEEPEYAAWRELVKEETNLILGLEDLHFFLQDTAWRKLTGEQETRYFYYAVIEDTDLENLEVYEGQGWAYIESDTDEDLIELWRAPVSAVFDAIKSTLR